MEEGYTVINKGSEIAPGLALVRSFIKNANGIIRLFVYNKCVETIRSLEGYCYVNRDKTEEIKEEPEKDGLHDHMCDAIRYFFINKFDKAKYVIRSSEWGKYSKSYMSKLRSKPGLKRCGLCHNPFISKTPKSEPPFICLECKEKKNAA